MVDGAALYTGQLRHRRFHPKPHAFTYSLFMAMVDVDQVEAQMQVSRVTSYNRFNWATFDQRDHLGDPSLPLRSRLAASAAAAGLALPDGPIRLLTHLRYLGYAFNPISFYYCYDRAGRLAAVLNEVNSTFGDQRAYWIDARVAHRTPAGLRHRTPKAMHVSPFMPMEMDYEFVLTEPGDALVAHMNTYLHGPEGARPYFDATLTLQRQPWSARTVRRALIRQPFMTAKVIGAIHWEAARLWFKGLPHYEVPAREPVASHPAEAEARRTR